MDIRNLFIGFVACFAVFSAHAQNDTTLTYEVTKPLYRPNIIKYNPTSSLVWSFRSQAISYERVLKPYQSVAFTMGHLSIPGLIEERSADTALFNFDKSKASGYTLLAEYRFYFKTENKGFAPSGLYFSPYTVHHNHRWESEANVEFDNGETARFDVFSQLITFGVGAQIGYQFSFFDDRLAVDLITFAPSYTFYSYDLGTTSSSSVNIEDYYPELVEWLLEEYPWLDTVTEGELVNFKGSVDALKIGARFVVQVGYRF